MTGDENARIGRSEGECIVTLTKHGLPVEYRPLPNLGLCLFVIAFSTFVGLGMGVGRQPWTALMPGVELGALSSPSFVFVWVKNSSRFLRLPPRTASGHADLALWRFLGAWRTPEGLQTSIAFLVSWNVMALVAGVRFFKILHFAQPGVIPDVGLFEASFDSWIFMWAVAYLIWWSGLPPGRSPAALQTTGLRRRPGDGNAWTEWRYLWPFASEQHTH